MNVVLVLGKKCNLNCTYCNNHVMQIAENCDITDTALMYMKAVTGAIVYYGGEPLLYWDDIKKCVENIPNANHIIFTNGKLLNSSKVQYCNEHNVRVMVSWDGDTSEGTRGYDALADNKANIMALNRLIISSVITNKNYIKGVLDSLEDVEKEYYDRHGEYFKIKLAPLKVGKYSVGVDDFDYQRVADEINHVIANYDNKITYKNYLDGLQEFYGVGVPEGGLGCGFGYNWVAIDRKGNYFPCQGYDNIVGNVITTSINEALESTADYDQYPERYRDICAECEAQPLCKNGCLIYAQDQLFVFCMLRRKLYTPIVRWLQSKKG